MRSIISYCIRIIFQPGLRLIWGRLNWLSNSVLRLIKPINTAGRIWGGLISVIGLVLTVPSIFTSNPSIPDTSRCFQPLIEFVAKETYNGAVEPPVVAADCKKEIVREFIEPEILKDFPLQSRIRLLKYVIEAAKLSNDFQHSDIANLYTALAFHYLYVNVTKYLYSKRSTFRFPILRKYCKKAGNYRTECP